MLYVPAGLLYRYAAHLAHFASTVSAQHVLHCGPSGWQQLATESLTAADTLPVALCTHMHAEVLVCWLCLQEASDHSADHIK
jgi:hypothetical protein